MSTVTRLPVAAKQHTGCPYCGLRGDEREPEPGVVIWGCMTVTNADDDAVYRSPGCVRMGGTDDEWDAEWIRLQDLISKRDAGII